jgi:hypothetical protein
VSPDEQHNITSYNQQGGITAHTVNAPILGATVEPLAPTSEGSSVVYRVRMRITAGHEAFAMQVGAWGDLPLDMRVGPEGGGSIMTTGEAEDPPPELAMVEIGGPLGGFYIAWITTDPEARVRFACKLLRGPDEEQGTNMKFPGLPAVAGHLAAAVDPTGTQQGPTLLALDLAPPSLS